MLKNSNLGPSGAHKIHTAANGGYYKDAYATDYYVSLGTYSGVCIEVTINNPGGWLKDQATSLSTIYPAAFNGPAVSAGLQLVGAYEEGSNTLIDEVQNFLQF